MFDFGSGSQQAGDKSFGLGVWDVGSGDVGVAVIPEPEMYAMLRAGLGLVGWHARRRRCFGLSIIFRYGKTAGAGNQTGGSPISGFIAVNRLLKMRGCCFSCSASICFIA